MTVEPARVLFIAGAGRSGTTFLGTVLGNHPELASFGELFSLPTAWLQNRTCACGERARSCPFWTAVLSRWQESAACGDVEGYLGLQEDLGRLRSWRRLVAELGRSSPELKRFRDQTVALLTAIRDLSGKTWLVDSSKHPSRALFLYRTQDVDVRMIHLVRDARGVLWSMKKDFRSGESGAREFLDTLPPVAPRSAWEAAAFWIRRNALADVVRRLMPFGASLRMRYEDLVAGPSVELARVGRLVGLDLGDLASAVEGGQEMAVGHTIAGNRLRFQGRVRLNPDTEWLAGLDPTERRRSWLLTGWLMRCYGYRRKAG